MPQQVFGADAVVSMVNRALANTSPSHSVYVNQVATAGATAASQLAYAQAVGAQYAAVGQGQRAAHEPRRLKTREQGAGQADVQNAVQGAHFMKGHFLRGKAVHRAFGLGQQRKGM